MNHYVGMLKIELAVRLRKKLELSFHGTQSGNPKVHVRDILERDEFGTKHESGIQFGVEVEAEDIEQARQRCGHHWRSVGENPESRFETIIVQMTLSSVHRQGN